MVRMMRAYYGADARRGQVRRVEAPEGYWRELDYGGAGWLVRREVQTADGSEVTAYTHDAWGRLRAIDYPRSADVRMGWDGESRRVWVQDGAGRREYTYTEWGQVSRQRGCCGSADGIEVVAVSAIYDEAGRKTSEREERADGSEVRTIRYTYDKLGRLETIGDDRGAVVYHYEAGTGRLQREDYPNGSYVEYTYYGSDNPSQVGFVWKVEHKRLADESLLIGYEYSYDLLGRVVQSVEYPSGDKTEYAYTPAGRLESEVREGQVWYRRYYGYNLDGSRHTVERDDMLNGEHVDVYAYDPVSGRLASVTDTVPQPDVVHSFAWNPEGTLARWSSNEPNSYARVFGYDEEGRLTKIERDYGGGNMQVAYEYGYNSDGARVWQRDVLNGQEYRYVCRIGCGGVPMRVYNRPTSGGSWASASSYLQTPTVLVSDTLLHRVTFGNSEWTAPLNSPEGEVEVVDMLGLDVGGSDYRRLSEEGIVQTANGTYVGAYLTSNSNGWWKWICIFGVGPGGIICFPIFVPDPLPKWYPGVPLPTDPGKCIDYCLTMGKECRENAKRWYDGMKENIDQICSGGLAGVGFVGCMTVCTGSSLGIGFVPCLAICSAIIAGGYSICLQLRMNFQGLYEKLIRHCEQKVRNCLERCPRPKPRSKGRCSIAPATPWQCSVAVVY
jgi:YD repeat-containing protein